MKDAGQKDLLYRHFRAQAWYVVVEVPVFHRGGCHGSHKLITDVDILALRPSPDLHWDMIVGDCKTKHKESPANRALWVRSLMDHFSAVRGIVVLRREKTPIEPDHKLFAHRLGVTLVDDQEFRVYDRAVVYPAGSTSFPETTANLRVVREYGPQRFPGLAPLSTYLRSNAWNEPDQLVMMRKTIGVGRGVRGEIDPAKPEHVALVLEAAGVFAIGFADCVGAVFHQCLQPSERTTLSEALKVLIWGGREQHDYITGLRRKIIEATGGGTDDAGDLALPEWDSFMHLVRSHLDAPHLAFQVPQLLRMAAIDVATRRTFLSHCGADAAVLVKLSMLVATYYAQACMFPPDMKAHVRELFVRRMSDLSSGQGAKRDVSVAPEPLASVRPATEVTSCEKQEKLSHANHPGLNAKLL